MKLKEIYVDESSYWFEVCERIFQDYVLTNKLNVPSLDTYCPLSESISGINPIILNLKQDLDSLYKSKSLFKLDIS